MQLDTQKNFVASCTHNVTRYICDATCLAQKIGNVVTSMLGCDWLTIEIVAKQVTRATSHVVLLCNLKKFAAESIKQVNCSGYLKKKKKNENSNARGGVTLHACNLEQIFSQDKLH